MSRTSLGYGLSVSGALALAGAVAWWWLVYSRVINGDYMTYRDAAPCMIASSDLCTLAEALCRGDHLFGIRRYSAALLWIGLALSGTGFFLAAERRSG